jgi:hypothetical protein
MQWNIQFLVTDCTCKFLHRGDKIIASNTLSRLEKLVSSDAFPVSFFDIMPDHMYSTSVGQYRYVYFCYHRCLWSVSASGWLSVSDLCPSPWDGPLSNDKSKVTILIPSRSNSFATLLPFVLGSTPFFKYWMPLPLSPVED